MSFGGASPGSGGPSSGAVALPSRVARLDQQAGLQGRAVVADVLEAAGVGGEALGEEPRREVLLGEVGGRLEHRPGELAQVGDLAVARRVRLARVVRLDRGAVEADLVVGLPGVGGRGVLGQREGRVGRREVLVVERAAGDRADAGAQDRDRVRVVVEDAGEGDLVGEVELADVGAPAREVRGVAGRRGCAGRCRASASRKRRVEAGRRAARRRRRCRRSAAPGSSPG